MSRAASGEGSPAGEPTREQLLAALAQARAEQAATDDILSAIGGGDVDLDTILGRLVRAALAPGAATRGAIWLSRGQHLVLAAQAGYPSEWAARVQADPIRPGPDSGTVGGHVAWYRQSLAVEDLPADPRFNADAAHRMAGDRACLAVPLLSDGAVVGAAVLARSEPGAFSDAQVDLLRRVSQQAAVAVQGARLRSEAQEAIERQTATAEILRVISKSPTDVQPVLDRIVETAKDVLRCETAVVILCEGDTFYAASIMTAQGLVTELSRRRLPVDVEANFPSRAIVEKKVVNFPDWSQIDLPEHERRVQAELSVRSSLFLPLLRANDCIGVLALVSSLAHNFGTREIAQAEAFRDQALIAIENARLFNETQEALSQQTATSEILRVISRSPTDARPVFDAIVVTAVRALRCDVAFVLMRDGDKYIHSAGASPMGPMTDLVPDSVPIDPAANFPSRAFLAGEMLYLADWSLIDLPEHERNIRAAFGVSSALYLPMLRDGQCIALLALVGTKPHSFGPKEIAQAESFRDQALIAIENARLFNETREALEQQTATAQVLQVIGRSVSDTAPVFETIMEACQRLFGLDAVAVNVIDRDRVSAVAHRGWTAGGWPLETLPLKDSTTGLAVAERRTIHVPDLTGGPALPEQSGPVRGSQARTVVCAPMLWEARGVGSLLLSRRPPRPFSEKELKLVQSFADQAAIAIQNARLFDEVRSKTRDLEESLAQQTATADVLKVISRSAFDLDRAASTILEAAARLCRATMATLHLRDGDVCRLATQIGMPEAFERLARENPIPVKYPLHSKRPARAGEVAHVADAWVDPDYLYKDTARLAGYRAIVVVPLMRDGELVGIFSLARPEPGPFSESQIKLTQTFADQAAIAIENSRLFKETQDSLEQQTATADVLKVISRSAFDLQPVFEMVAESAVRLCEAERAVIFRFDGDVLRAVASHNVGPDLWAYIVEHPISPGRGSTSARAAQSRRTVRMDDAQADPEYTYASKDVEPIRAIAAVPMIRGGDLVGTITIYKLEPKPFTDRQISLVETFAEQAVIAIENVRLFDEVQARTRQLAASLHELRTTQDRLIQTEKLASLGQLTAGIAHEIKNPLNFVNNFAALSVELVDELQEVLAPVSLDEAARGEVDEISGMLKSNLDKVASHGKRADSIVRNMLLHSRSGSGERRRVDVNGLVEESLNLAYHGACAEKSGFSVTLERDYDGGAGAAELFPQEVTRVLLNLIGNGFYAVTKRAESAGSGYEPRLTVATRDLGGAIEIRVRDNGTGIPDDVKQKMFDPFYTTKPAGEGTGLGLSLSHDIIVKQHDGRIEVATQPGAFTEFTITLPRDAAARLRGGEA